MVPFPPLLASLREERFADVHVTQKLFAAIVAKAFDEPLVADLRSDLTDGLSVRNQGVGDQVARYVRGELRPIYFYPDELKRYTEARYRPGAPRPTTDYRQSAKTRDSPRSW